MFPNKITFVTKVSSEFVEQSEDDLKASASNLFNSRVSYINRHTTTHMHAFIDIFKHKKNDAKVLSCQFFLYSSLANIKFSVLSLLYM